MTVGRKIEDFLKQNNVQYQTLPHATAYTAQETAAAAHVHGRELAKAVIVNTDGEMVMAVLPASLKVDLAKFQQVTGAKSAALAHESAFAHIFQGCELGAEPPFGNLYGMKVYVDKALTFDSEIAFNAGTHTDLIKMKYADYERLVKPVVAEFALGR